MVVDTPLRLSAILIGKQLNLKGIKVLFPHKPIADNAIELFFEFEKNRYICFYSYGIVTFQGFGEDEIKATINTIKPFTIQERPWLRDDHDISISNDEDMQFEFDHIKVSRLDGNVIRIAMLNLAQSVALDQYHETMDALLMQIKGIANELETSGKLKFNRKNMMKFLGKALNTQNDIAENIYVFDAPDLVWEDEYLDKFHQNLMKYFDLRVRFTEVEYTLRIIKDNLAVFREISSQRESNTMELIIIILILFEVFDLIISKFM